MTALLLVRETVNTTLSTPETTARIAKAGQHPVHNRTGIKNGLKGHGFGPADVCSILTGMLNRNSSTFSSAMQPQGILTNSFRNSIRVNSSTFAFVRGQLFHSLR